MSTINPMVTKLFDAIRKNDPTITKADLDSMDKAAVEKASGISDQDKAKADAMLDDLKNNTSQYDTGTKDGKIDANELQAAYNKFFQTAPGATIDPGVIGKISDPKDSSGTGFNPANQSAYIDPDNLASYVLPTNKGGYTFKDNGNGKITATAKSTSSITTGSTPAPTGTTEPPIDIYSKNEGGKITNTYFKAGGDGTPMYATDTYSDGKTYYAGGDGTPISDVNSTPQITTYNGIKINPKDFTDDELTTTKNLLDKLKSDPDGSKLVQKFISQGGVISRDKNTGNNAYAAGSNISLGNGTFGSDQGNTLAILAHEMTHADTQNDGDSKNEEALATTLGERIRFRAGGSQPFTYTPMYYGQNTLTFDGSDAAESKDYQSNLYGLIAKSSDNYSYKDLPVNTDIFNSLKQLGITFNFSPNYSPSSVA